MEDNSRLCTAGCLVDKPRLCTAGRDGTFSARDWQPAAVVLGVGLEHMYGWGARTLVLPDPDLGCSVEALLRSHVIVFPRILQAACHVHNTLHILTCQPECFNYLCSQVGSTRYHVIPAEDHKC
jgi:hypothetical protein